MSFTLFQIHCLLFAIFAEKIAVEKNINHTFQFYWRYCIDNTCNSLYQETDTRCRHPLSHQRKIQTDTGIQSLFKYNLYD